MRSFVLGALCVAPLVIALGACGSDEPGSGGKGGGAGSGGSPSEPAGGSEPEPEPGLAGEHAGGSGTAGNAGEAPIAEGGAGGAAPEGDRSRDILDTTLEVDVEARHVKASITLAPSASTGASFEIGDLDIVSVAHDGKKLRYIDHGFALDIEVPASDEPLVIDIEYGFHFHDDSDGVSSKGYTLTWPYFCGNVFPCHPGTEDGTKFHLKLVNVDSSQTAIYPNSIETDAPPYMAAWIIGDYTELPLGETSNGTSLSMWYLPGGKADAEAGSEHLADAFEWLEEHIGAYPFGSHAGAVAAPWGSGALGGMEHHPYWHMAVDSMKDSTRQVHEAAHGWFGNGVRLRCWEDFVLSEGTATYLAARVLDEVAGPDVSGPIWQGYQDELDKLRASGIERPVWRERCDSVSSITSGGLFSRAPYIRGAFFYRALEEKVGRAQLDEALGTFYTRYVGTSAGMQDLLDVVEEVTGYDPRDCAQTWLLDVDTVPEPGACP